MERTDGGVGIIRWSRALDALCDPARADAADEPGELQALQESNFVWASEDELFFDVITRMRRAGADLALVTRADDRSPAEIVGLVTSAELGRALSDDVEDFAD